MRPASHAILFASVQVRTWTHVWIATLNVCTDYVAVGAAGSMKNWSMLSLKNVLIWMMKP